MNCANCFRSYDEAPADNWLMPQSNGAYGYANTEPHSKRQSDVHDTWDVRGGMIPSRSEADNSEVSRNASAAKDSKQLETSPEVEEDVKGNIMS